MTDLLEIEHSDYTSWAFTLRKTTKKRLDPNEEIYLTYIENLCQKTNTILKEYVFEQTGGLHMHGVLQIHHATNMKLFRTRGWKMHLVNIWDYDGWRNYFMKEQLLQEIEDQPLNSDQEDRYIAACYNLRHSLFKR